ARGASTRACACFAESSELQRSVIQADVPPQTKKLVLVVVDSLKREMLARSIADHKAPLFGEIVRRGTSVSECVSVFPSVTPAASASITTGAGAAEHGVPSINWYHRGESRYVEYGSSWPA